MAADPMASAWAKYNWASRHMQAVDRAISASIDPERHAVNVDVEVEPDAHGVSAMVRIASLPTIRQDCGLALGDVIQNFRAALDHLAWGLVKVGTDPRPRKPERVYFPMAKSGDSFRTKVNEWLPGVPDKHRKIIRRYQPYRRGDQAKTIRWLRNLSDTDKHRVLIPMLVHQTNLNLTVATNWPVRSWEPLVRPHALHVGTPLLRIGMLPVLGTDCQVQVNGQGAIYPSLGYGVPLGDSLASIRTTVYEILRECDQLL